MTLEGRVVLVTGAGTRVGRALATACLGHGARVAVHYHRSAHGAEEVVHDATALGREAAAFRADLTDPSAPGHLIESVTSRFGGLDVLVNSAAVMERTPFGEVSAVQWDGIIALNLRAPFLLSQAAAPFLRESTAEGGGVIINIADVAAFETWPGYVPHGLSKNGLVYLTRALAQILAPRVRVNAIAPGTVLLPEGWQDDSSQRLEGTTPLGRHGSPADVVEAMLYLLSAAYVTGDTLVVDGGRRVRR